MYVEGVIEDQEICGDSEVIFSRQTPIIASFAMDVMDDSPN
jgi:hypothetical protein